jgi:DNA-binding transcriptional regulator LsrR (DeoR family)
MARHEPRDGDTVRGADAAPEVADPQEQQATRAAWLYYIAGLTQTQIAKQLGLNRIRVNRMLAQAREQGMVQIRINTKLASCVALENELVRRFDLREAIVVPTPPEPDAVSQVIAVAAGAALSDRIRDGMSVGVGWGRTLHMSLQSVARRPTKRLRVVSLLGGLTRGSAINPHETATRLADLLGAQCHYVAAPVYTNSAATRDMLIGQPMLREVLALGRKVDLAFLSVGALTADATMVTLGLVSAEEVRSLRKVGAVGDLCGQWIDANGAIVAHSLNRRVVGLSPADLQDIPCVMLASGGKSKVPALHGTLAGGLVDVLVTDEETAAGILVFRGQQVRAAQ